MTSPRPDTVSLSEVAQLAGVRPSAVSNWRSRSADFPMPVDGTRYLRAEIETWLRQHNKDVRVSRSTADGGQLLWHSADALRAMAPVEEILVLLLQILTLRATAGTTREATLWPTLLREPSGLSDALVELGPRLAPDDHFWRSALEPSAFARHIPPSAALSVLRAVDDLPRNSDWARVALEIVSGFPTRFGMRGAESFTPTGLGAVLLAMAGPVRGTVYDPASGTGSLLAMAAEAAGAADVRLYGQDIGVYAHRLSQLLLRLRSTPAELALGDTLVDDRFADVRADLVLAQPPINLRIPYRDALQFDARWAWGIPNGTADWLWAQHAYSHLAQGGVAVIVLSAGPLFRDADAQIRRRMLEDDALEAVVQLPHAMTPETSVHMVAVVRGPTVAGCSLLTCRSAVLARAAGSPTSPPTSSVRWRRCSAIGAAAAGSRVPGLQALYRWGISLRKAATCSPRTTSRPSVPSTARWWRLRHVVLGPISSGSWPRSRLSRRT
jgi:hypothetical protein